MSEEGVNIINGTNPPLRSRSPSPTRSDGKEQRKDGEEEKPRRFQNGWSKEQERLMADWSDIASCYRWIHDKSEKIFHSKTLWINLPVIVLSTLGGTANFGIQSLFDNDENAKKLASFAIGGVSLLAGMLTTVGNYLRYAQLEESHRVASIAWGKFQRLIAVELSLNPDDRMDSLDFLKICRAELDRLIEQSPPIPESAIKMFENRFGTIKDLKKPDICGALEHTSVFQSSETRLKQMAVEAALLLKHKSRTLNELVSPQIEKRIADQVETRVKEAIEKRRGQLEEEIEMKRMENAKQHEELTMAIEERKKRLEEEIELEKKKLYQEPIAHAQAIEAASLKAGGSQFESRLNFRRSSVSHGGRRDTPKKPPRSGPTGALDKSPPLRPAGGKNDIYAFDLEGGKNTVVVPPDAEQHRQDSDDTIIIINRED
jgi:hypothetical protein